MATNTKSELEIVKRNDYLTKEFGEEMEVGDITKGDQIDAKKKFQSWFTTLTDQKRKTTIAEGISVLEETGQHVEEYLTAKNNLQGSLDKMTKLGEGKFLYGMYVAITGVSHAKRNTPEDARWSLFINGYLKHWGFTRSVVYSRFAAYRDTLALVASNAPQLTSEAIVKVAEQIATFKVTPSTGKPAGKLTDAVTNTISAAANKPGLNLSDAKGIQTLISSLDNLKPSTTQTVHTKMEILMELYNDTMRGILRACKATEPGFEHGNVERVMNDFMSYLLKGLNYEGSVTFKVAGEMDKEWKAWDEIVPRSKTIGEDTAPMRSEHGFYIKVSTEERHKSEPYRVYQHVEGRRNDQFCNGFRKEKEANKYIDQREANATADDAAEANEKENKAAKSEGEAAAGASA
jgi:hypothetical protein